MHRKDLPCYNIPKKYAKKAKKRKFECVIDGTEEKSEAKRPACFKCITGKKHSKSVTNKASTKPKKSMTSNDCKLTNAVGVGVTSYPNFRYYQIDECWQLQTCTRLGLQFVKKFICSVGSVATVLTPPNLRGLKQISGDGNCLFRAISFIITGSEEQHFIL